MVPSYSTYDYDSFSLYTIMKTHRDELSTEAQEGMKQYQRAYRKTNESRIKQQQAERYKKKAKKEKIEKYKDYL